MAWSSGKMNKARQEAKHLRMSGMISDAFKMPSKASLRDMLAQAAANTAAIKTDEAEAQQ